MNSFGVLFPLALIIIVFAFYLLRRSRQMHREAEGAWYSFPEREIKTQALGVSLQAVVLFVLGGVILVWLLLTLLEMASEPTSPGSPVEPVSTLTSLPPPVRSSATPTDTLPLDISPTLNLEGQPELVPIPTTPLTSQAIITNTNGNGLILRDAPFGNQIVILPEGSTIFVRGGLTEVQGIMWQNVVDLDGREGWVAADYLIYR